MVTDKGKKQKVAAKGEEQIDGELVLSIEKLQEIQDELEKINEKASDELLEVEQKYNKERKPFYDKRKEIIQSIPEFWLTAFLSHPALSQLLSDEDQKIFKHLESLEVEEFKDVRMGYTISFNFNPNPYFDDSKLSKTFNILDEGTVKVTATPIKWKEGMGISGGDFEKKGNKRPLEEESFFSWFEESEDMDDMNDQVAEIIKEDLWPSPLTYFNNEVDEEDFEDEDDEDVSHSDSDDNGDNEDDDDKE